MKKLLLILIFLIIVISISLYYCLRETVSDELELFMSAYQEYCSYEYSGVILVAQDDTILLHEAYGLADHDQQVPNSLDTVFPYASISKSMTAYAVMQLVEEGSVSLDAFVTDYIPSFTLGSDITIHQLLTHTSGLQREGKFTFSKELSLDDHLAFLNSHSYAYKPGVKHMYSNAGYIVLAAIIERVSGVPYEDYLSSHLFSPLGMDGAFTSNDDTYAPNQALGYRIIPDSVATDLDIYHFSRIIGSGNIIGTASDLFAYARSYATAELLSRESLDLMTTDHVDGYGYGWFTEERFGEKKIYHGGVIGNCGYNSQIVIYPESGYTLVFLTNNDDRTALNDVESYIEHILFEEDYVLPHSTQRVAVSPELLESYAGGYEFAEGIIVDVTYDSGKLYSTADDGNVYELIPESDTQFVYEGHPCTMGEFSVSEDDESLVFTVISKTNRISGKKVE